MAKCMQCNKTLVLSKGTTKSLRTHLVFHEEYKRKLIELESKAAETASKQSKIGDFKLKVCNSFICFVKKIFILQPTKDDESKKIVIHAIAENDLSFRLFSKSRSSFTRLFNPAVRIFDESHYRQTVLPQCALGMKREITKLLATAGTLSAATDIWSQYELALLGCANFVARFNF